MLLVLTAEAGPSVSPRDERSWGQEPGSSPTIWKERVAADREADKQMDRRSVEQ
jgi:hypothetical protein